MATTKITSPDLFDLGSLNTALQLPNGTTAERPTSPSTGEWRYNTTTNLVEFYDGGAWRELESEDIPPIPSEHFKNSNFGGTNSAQSITQIGFQPDLIWFKARTGTNAHAVFDSSRGNTKSIYPNSTDAQNTSTAGQDLTSFDSDGYSVGTVANAGSTNQLDIGIQAWCWKVNGGTTTSNGEGSISSTVQVNDKAGISIVEYTGNVTAGATVGHGLSTAPSLIILKNLTRAGYGWLVYHQTVGATGALVLNTTSSTNTGVGYFNDTAPSSTVFTLGNDTFGNYSGDPYIAYCFAEKTGYSKFGSYTGTGNEQYPPIAEIGFEPAFLMIKNITGGGDWMMHDNLRSPANPRGNYLSANSTNAEAYNYELAPLFLTNGFRVGFTTSSNYNTSGQTYVYIAFAKDPSETPTATDFYKGVSYTGNDYSLSVGDVGFTPAITWIKSYDLGRDHSIFDKPRQSEQRQNSAVDQQEYFQSGGGYLQAWGGDGFNVVTGSSNSYNVVENAINYVAWNFKGTTAPTNNSAGNLLGVNCSNQAAGVSCVRYIGKEQVGDTLGHNLGGTPEIAIIKQCDGTREWTVPFLNEASGTYGVLSNTNAKATDTNRWSAVDSTTLTVNSDPYTNGVNSDYLAYFFRSVAGYTKVGTYEGNQTTGVDNQIDFGFAPGFVMIKNIDSGSTDWVVFDNTRTNGYALRLNDSGMELDYTADLLLSSTGLKFLSTYKNTNQSGDTYIYIACAAPTNTETYSSAGNMAFLCVGAGGSGGQNYGGGGGAGGLQTSVTKNPGFTPASSTIALASGTYTITIGAGGASVSTLNVRGNPGADSSIAGPSLTTITSVGGGAGSGGSGNYGANGGSGGGGSYGETASNGGIPGQGHGGGFSTVGGSPYTTSGGGGAGAPGCMPTSVSGGSGVVGMTFGITGSDVTYAGGGGGGYASHLSKVGGYGGAGGGGNGGRTGANDNGTAGTANTGGGGGGTGGQNSGSAISGAGGSGVVILRLLTSEYTGTTTGSPTVTTSGSETILTYTGSGTYVHS